ncbi:MAG: hypothetical protein ACRCZZ_06855 [Phocaeicola sp.]
MEKLQVGDKVVFKTYDEMIADGYCYDEKYGFDLPSVNYTAFEMYADGEENLVTYVDVDNTFTIKGSHLDGYWFPFESVRIINKNKEELVMEYHIDTVMEALKPMVMEQISSAETPSKIIGEAVMGMPDRSCQADEYFSEDPNEPETMVLEEFELLGLTCYRLLDKNVGEYDHFFFNLAEAQRTLASYENTLEPTIQQQIDLFKEEIDEDNVSVQVNKVNGGQDYRFTVESDGWVVLHCASTLSPYDFTISSYNIDTLCDDIRKQYDIELTGIESNQDGTVEFMFEKDGVSLGFSSLHLGASGLIPVDVEAWNQIIPIPLDGVKEELESYHHDEYKKTPPPTHKRNGKEALLANLLSPNPCVNLQDYFKEYKELYQMSDWKTLNLSHLIFVSEDAFDLYFEHEYGTIDRALKMLSRFPQAIEKELEWNDLPFASAHDLLIRDNSPEEIEAIKGAVKRIVIGLR